MNRMGRWLSRLTGWLSGANRDRPYRSAIDRDIEKRNQELADLARRVAAYEERAELMRELERDRRGEKGWRP